MADDVSARSTLTVGDRKLEIHRLDALQDRWDVVRLPYTLRILLENVLRNGDSEDVEAVHIGRFEPTGRLRLRYKGHVRRATGGPSRPWGRSSCSRRRG